MEEDKPLYAPGSPLVIHMNPFLKAYISLIDDLMKRGIEPIDAANLSMEMCTQFLNFTNNAKIAENLGPEIMFVPEDQE